MLVEEEEIGLFNSSRSCYGECEDSLSSEDAVDVRVSIIDIVLIDRLWVASGFFICTFVQYDCLFVIVSCMLL